ncbi:TPA: NUDIX domain-containing protein [Candidatus Berkelbacteria bacterium]|uniref:NUDIX hydrolase n=1 Tax=Berkelbacteria bacterium GW2011_GWE1_39_12 TaxID=1618337 RepID=A0A0G4B735_9BACT|nr:MAG: NUDIX hydrolase [Berkelbacteria bacterium GW2011_GWE1_39_12]HBO60115.1 NUDIX domain-containing protein [Candidatus Berkelbacteria bacterium]
MKLEFSAGGIVYKKQGDDIYFAVILNHDKQWTFPKGHIEKGEKPEEAAIREVGEEIGIPNLQIENLLEKIDYWFVFKGDKIHKFVYFYLLEAPAEAELIPQLEEVGDAQWLKPTELLDSLKYKEDFSITKKAFSLLKIDSIFNK